MSIFAVRRWTLDDIWRHPDFVSFGSSNDDWLRDEDRMERCNEAAEHGSDGSYHAEILDDYQDFLDELTLPFKVRERIETEIDDCRKWHEKNGSLYQQVG